MSDKEAILVGILSIFIVISIMLGFLCYQYKKGYECTDARLEIRDQMLDSYSRTIKSKEQKITELLKERSLDIQRPGQTFDVLLFGEPAKIRVEEIYSRTNETEITFTKKQL